MQARHFRARRGFTLIELLIVVVIIGILAAIAIPRFSNTKGKAYLTSMKSDLHHLAVAQEGYFFDNHIYANSLAQLGPAAATSSGVVHTILSGDATGWAATSTHPAATPLTCYIFVGNHGPNGPATVAGSVVCQ